MVACTYKWDDAMSLAADSLAMNTVIATYSDCNIQSCPLLHQTLVVAMPLLTIVLWTFGKQDVEDLVCGLLGERLSCMHWW